MTRHDAPSRMHSLGAAPLAVALLLGQAATEPASEKARPAPEVRYNEGVALYREGRLSEAKERFGDAASRARAEVAARALYNGGTTRYAETLPLVAADQSDEARAAMRPQAIVALEDALQTLKDAMRADPGNRDARVNAELAHRLLKKLREEERRQEEEQQQQEQEQQQQQQQQEQEQEQEQEQQNQQQQQQQDQQQQEQEQEQEQQQQQQREEQRQEKQMSRNEIERLLQRVRERERARLEQLASRTRGQTSPAPRDW